MNRRILIVDDIVINRKLAAAMLRRDGWEIDEAADGGTALDMLGRPHDFSAILLDISMPGLSGEEVCRTLRSVPDHQKLPIVAYTAHTQETQHSQLYMAGFDAILIKPVSILSLRTALNKALAVHT